MGISEQSINPPNPAPNPGTQYLFFSALCYLLYFGNFFIPDFLSCLLIVSVIVKCYSTLGKSGDTILISTLYSILFSKITSRSPLAFCPFHLKTFHPNPQSLLIICKFTFFIIFYSVIIYYPIIISALQIINSLKIVNCQLLIVVP